MSNNLSPLRALGIALVFSMATVLAGCDGYTGDAGAERTEQESQMLRDRLRQVQADR